MKYGFRTPSFKKSFKARTTGRLKRTYKRALNPWYGRKGMGYLHNPRKAIYNGIYRRTTVSPIPRSKTKAYRHAYYMKRKYGYVPSNTGEKIEREQREQYGATLDDTNWYQQAQATDDGSNNEDLYDADRVKPDPNHYVTIPTTSPQERARAKRKQDWQKIASFSPKQYLTSGSFKARLLKYLNVAMYFFPFVIPLLMAGFTSATDEACTFVMTLTSLMTAGYALYFEGYKQDNDNFGHLLIYSLILAVWFLLLSL